VEERMHEICARKIGTVAVRGEGRLGADYSLAC